MQEGDVRQAVLLIPTCGTVSVGIAVDEEVRGVLLSHLFEVALDSVHGAGKSTRRGEDPDVNRTGAPSSRTLDPDGSGGEHGVCEGPPGRFDGAVEDVALGPEELTQRLG